MARVGHTRLWGFPLLGWRVPSRGTHSPSLPPLKHLHSTCFALISRTSTRLCFYVIRSFLPSLPAGCRHAHPVIKTGPEGMVGRFYQNLQKGWVPPLRWRRRPHPRAGLARTTSLLNERMTTSICGVGLSQRDHGIAATDHGEHHFLPAGAHNPLEPRNSNVAPNSASGHYCDGRGHIGWVY